MPKMTVIKIEQVLTGDKMNGEVSSAFDNVIWDFSIKYVDGFKVI